MSLSTGVQSNHNTIGSIQVGAGPCKASVYCGLDQVIVVLALVVTLCNPKARRSWRGVLRFLTACFNSSWCISFHTMHWSG